MPWDDDLERLSQRARDLLGDEVYHDALRRMVGALWRQGQPITPDSAIGEIWPPETFTDRQPAEVPDRAMDAACEALRAELRRLLRPQ
jgi:hypothetical protein